MSKNVLGTNLRICGEDPMTGYERTGFCKLNEQDRGTHTVCAEMTQDFLNYTKLKGNDLITKRGSFPGLKPGDRWCLCASRWEQARRAGVAPPVILDATQERTLNFTTLANLKGGVA